MLQVERYSDGLRVCKGLHTCSAHTYPFVRGGEGGVYSSDIVVPRECFQSRPWGGNGGG